MITLTSLINNQSVRVDNHDSGSGRPFDWGTGVHIHKETDDKDCKIQFTLNLEKVADIRFIKSSGDRDKQKRVKNEVKKAFKDKAVKKRFIKELGAALKRLNDNALNKLSEKDFIEKLKISAQSVVNLFGEDYKSQANSFEDDEIFSSIFTDKHDDRIIIQQNIKKQHITISRSLQAIKKFGK